MYRRSMLLGIILASDVSGKRHGHAIDLPVAHNSIATPAHHQLSDSDILEGLSNDTDKERTLLRKTSKTFTSLNNKLKSVLRSI